ncbi:hypothetical protein BST83_17610 [Polaribacter filamentus]|uniref:Uncharacterized protein n=1 Tax=Polaribacter filamentus TaxID=53483 RepID=A0A2S7KKL8_9FLAO|nr:hypothetical protein [Polaribacter filamentus]PQB03141.1 hypothetical protein BST83_17610 [Polaribacter filamentus]
MNKKLLNKGVHSLFNILGTLLFTLILIPQNIAAQKSMSDQDQIITKCITIEQLEAKIPVDVKAQMSEYYILNSGIKFYFSSTFEISNKKTSLISKGEISLNKPYFLFHTLNIDNEKAFVRYYFIYSYNDVETTVPITIEFVKNNFLWQILNYKI